MVRHISVALACAFARASLAAVPCDSGVESCANDDIPTSASLLQFKTAKSSSQHLESDAKTTREWVHPGILVNKEQLDFMKEQYELGVGATTAAAEKLATCKYGKQDYTPLGPPGNGKVVCGSYSNPDDGCSEENDDSSAAFGQAMLWYMTGEQVYAENSLKIIRAYTGGLKTKHEESNAALQAGWTIEKFVPAAEILRYASGSGFTDDDATAFLDMIANVYRPVMERANYKKKNGNWWFTGINALMSVAVFREDQGLFDKCIQYVRDAVPAFFYIASDGDKPNTTDEIVSHNWNGQTVFNETSNGVGQETCRDTAHMLMGISSLFGVLETAYLQGVDLYPEMKERLLPTLEFHAELVRTLHVPDWLCIEDNNQVVFKDKMTFEIAYIAYAVRMGEDMPKTKKWLQYQREQSIRFGHGALKNVCYEQVHHGAWYSKKDAGSCTVSSPGPLPALGKKHLELPGEPNRGCSGDSCTGTVSFSMWCEKDLSVKFTAEVLTPDSKADTVTVGLEGGSTSTWSLGVRTEWSTSNKNSVSVRAKKGKNTVVLIGKEDGLKIASIKIVEAMSGTRWWRRGTAGICSFEPLGSSDPVLELDATDDSVSVTGKWVKGVDAPVDHSLWCGSGRYEIGDSWQMPAWTTCDVQCADGTSSSKSEVFCDFGEVTPFTCD